MPPVAPVAAACPKSTSRLGSALLTDVAGGVGTGATVTQRAAPTAAIAGVHTAVVDSESRKRERGALEETLTTNPNSKPYAQASRAPVPTAREVLSAEPFARKSFAVRPRYKTRSGHASTAAAANCGADTDSEPDDVLRSVAGSLEHRAELQMKKVFGESPGSPQEPRPSTAGADAGAGLGLSGDTLRLLLQRVSHLEADVKSLKSRAATEEQASLGEDATAAGLKAAVEALAAASASFARKREFDSGVIDRALDGMWPDGSFPLVGADGKLLRALARSLVMASCKQHVVTGDRAAVSQADIAKRIRLENEHAHEEGFNVRTAVPVGTRLLENDLAQGKATRATEKCSRL